jgi:hybrid cluster-associated redox disulfide protein
MNDPQKIQPITADCLVQEVVERHPQVVVILARHGLHCAGCYISPYHTIADSAREYAIWIEPLLEDLNQSICATS